MATTIGSLDLNAFSDLYSDSNQYFWFESNASATYGAGAHVTLVPDTSFISNPTGQNILMNTDGFSIRDGLLPMMVLDNNSLDFNIVDTTEGTYTKTATFTATGAQIGQSGGAHVQISSSGLDVNTNSSTNIASFSVDGARIGQSGGAHSVIDANGQRFYASDGTTQLANIGYGKGASSSGTVDNAPYFTFGTRRENASVYNSSETYVVGDVVSYNGSIYVCYEKVSTPEPFDSNKWGLSIGNYSCTGGEYNLASGASAHAEGASTKAIGVFSHAEGFTSKAIGIMSHSEGSGSSAIGACSHAEGASVAEGDYSHSQNYLTEASFSYQTVIGRYNDNQQDTAFEIGNGTSDTSRSNALTVDWDGNLIAKGMAGIIQMFAGSYLPKGWLLCDGSAVSRSTYFELYSVIGTTYGAGDGTNTFNLPDFRGRVGIGVGTGTAEHATNHDLGDMGGDEDAVVPYHNHSVNSVSIGSSGGHSHTITNKYTSGQLASGSNSPRFRTDGNTSTTNFSSIASNTGTHTHSVPSHNTNYAGTSGNKVGANMMPYAVVNFIICTGKTY